MFRRILGLIILVATAAMLIVLLAVAFYIGPALDAVGESVDSGLALSIETLHTVSSTLEQTQSTLVAVNASMETAAQTTQNLSVTVADTIPLLEQVAVVVSDQLPENVAAIQTAVPNIAAVAGVVDTTLTRLSNFGIQQTIPIPFNPIEIDFDLGIEYDPVEPFDQTIGELGTSLDGLPEELRMLRGQLETSAANLQTLSEDLGTASEDLDALNVELAKFIPLLDQYLDLLDRVVVAITNTQEQITANLDTVGTLATILPIILAFTQLAPLVVGWDLVTARNEPQVIVQDVDTEPEPEPQPDAVVVVEEISEPEESGDDADEEDRLSAVVYDLDDTVTEDREEDS